MSNNCILGGVIDVTFFVTDTPEEMVALYTDTIGKPFMPPRWALGFQLSRWGYDTLDKMDQVVKGGILNINFIINRLSRFL